MEHAMKALLLLAILFLAMLLNGERFGHVAKAQTIDERSSLLKSAAKAMLAMKRRRLRAMQSCRSRTTMSGS